MLRPKTVPVGLTSSSVYTRSLANDIENGLYTVEGQTRYIHFLAAKGVDANEQH
jgi:hypothetical protein